MCVRQDEIHTSRTTRVQRAGSSFTLGCVGGACAAFVRSFVRSGRTRRRREREEDGKRIAQSTTGSDPRSAVHRPCARFRYLSNSTQLGRRSSPTEPSKQKTHPCTEHGCWFRPIAIRFSRRFRGLRAAGAGSTAEIREP